jgi:hypothetical protein
LPGGTPPAFSFWGFIGPDLESEPPYGLKRPEGRQGLHPPPATLF